MDKINGSFSPVHMKLDDSKVRTPKYADNQVDMKDLYSQEELDALVARFGCLHPTGFDGTQKCQFSTIFLPTSETVIINNQSMTNDTVEVYKNGHAISVGSWHRKDLDGDYSDVIADVKSRVAEDEAKGEAKIGSQMDSMAELGKSQLYVNRK